MWRPWIAVVTLLGSCSDEQCTNDRISEHHAELAACEPGDTCIVDEANPCTKPFNMKMLERYREIASVVDGKDCPIVDCFHLPENPRCEAGECVGDYPINRADAGVSDAR